MAEALRKPDADDRETERLLALDRLDVLDTSREEAFDRIARLIRLSLGVETGIVSLMDGHRQWYKAVEGSPNLEVPLNETFCKTMLVTDEPLLVPDASQDGRFQANPHVTDGGVRFYAGVPLRTRDGQIVGSVCAIDSTARTGAGPEVAILAELAQIAMNELELRQIASVDSLTGGLSRRAFKDDARRYVSLARRHRSALSVISFDLDHFKSINDTYGHAAGDQVLSGVARAAAKELRQSDILGRMGGEEFAVLLPQTDQTRAAEVADKLRLLFRSLKFPGSHPPIKVNASFGVASLDPGSDDIDSLLQKADEALYDAKRNGRNRVSIWRAAGVAPQGERRRVLKAGRIVYNDRFSAVDCTVRALWDKGAELQVSGTLGIPDAFNLVIRSDNADWPCHVTNCTDTKLVVEFV
jgi:diguanylate cyclase (GGDEF)-like protein